LDALITCGKYDVVLHGHTHTQRHETIGKTIVINPGSVHGFKDTASMAVFDTESKELGFIEL
jgi:hypothetical protein